MKGKNLIIFLLNWVLLGSITAIAQENEISLQEVNQDSLGNVTDDFQEYFFEALKQKGIENYEKAIEALEKCEKIEPENPVIHFEKGKNLKLLKNYEAAVQSLQKANRLKPNQEWVLVHLMEAHYLNLDYEPAILLAKKLTSFNSKYYNNLADLYMRSQKYDELLTLLDSLDAELGVDEYRLGLRQQIYKLTNNKNAQIKVIKDAIAANPEKELNYLNLVYVYTEEGLEKQAFEAAEVMKKKFPNSKVVHLALYKFYLKANNMEGALESMKIVFNAEEIDANSKFKVLNDFLIFVNENPQYESELKEVTTLFSESENSPGVFQKLGEFYSQKGQKEQALTFFELGVNEDLDNFDLVRNTLLLQLDLSKFSEAAQLSEKAIEIFPAQPFIYLARGAALNELQEFKEAQQILTFGLDYVIDNPKMEFDFFEQLVKSYSGLGDTDKASEFQQKANEIKNPQN